MACVSLLSACLPFSRSSCSPRPLLPRRTSVGHAPATDTITVQGDGQATSPPDVARVSFTVENTSATVAEAQIITTEQTNAALAFCKRAGVADKDVKTLSYNISPQYSYPNPCQPGMLCPDYNRAEDNRLPGLTDNPSDDARPLGRRRAPRRARELEVQNVNGPAFALDDSTEGLQRRAPMQLIKRRAGGTSRHTAWRSPPGKIVNFSESSGGYPYPMMYDLGGASNPSRHSERASRREHLQRLRLYHLRDSLAQRVGSVSTGRFDRSVVSCLLHVVRFPLRSAFHLSERLKSSRMTYWR